MKYKKYIVLLYSFLVGTVSANEKLAALGFAVNADMYKVTKQATEDDAGTATVKPWNGRKYRVVNPVEFMKQAVAARTALLADVTISENGDNQLVIDDALIGRLSQAQLAALGFAVNADMYKVTKQATEDDAGTATVKPWNGRKYRVVNPVEFMKQAVAARTALLADVTISENGDNQLVIDDLLITKLLKPTPPTPGLGTPAAGSGITDRKEEDIEREVGQFWPNGELVKVDDGQPGTGSKRKLKCVVTGTIAEEEAWVVGRSKKAKWTVAEAKDGGPQTLQDLVNSIAAASAA